MELDIQVIQPGGLSNYPPMEGTATKLGEQIRHEIRRRYQPVETPFATALFQLYDTSGVDTSGVDTPEAILDGLGNRPFDPAYLNALPANELVELLMLMHVLEKHLPTSSRFGAFQEAIADLATGQIRNANWGFLGGAASILTYFTLRGPTTNRSVYCEKLLEVYDTVLDPETYTYANGAFKRRATDLLNDYSLAQGQTGLLIALLKACKQEKNNLRIGSTVQRLTDWIRTRLHGINGNIIDVNWESNHLSFFPMKLEEGNEVFHVDNRLSWATGDLGLVFLLYSAAEFWQNPNYYRIAEQIGTYTLLRKDSPRTGISHADIKTGAAGLTYMYDALWRHSQNEKYRQGAIVWQRQTADLLAKDLREDHYRHTFFSLLEGPIGAWLVDQAINNPDPRPDWLDLLLL